VVQPQTAKTPLAMIVNNHLTVLDLGSQVVWYMGDRKIMKSKKKNS
jgi:hypothetical protein